MGYGAADATGLWWDAVLQTRLVWALFGVMGYGAAVARWLGFVCFVVLLCCQPAELIVGFFVSYFFQFYPPPPRRRRCRCRRPRKGSDRADGRPKQPTRMRLRLLISSPTCQLPPMPCPWMWGGGGTIWYSVMIYIYCYMSWYAESLVEKDCLNINVYRGCIEKIGVFGP